MRLRIARVLVVFGLLAGFGTYSYADSIYDISWNGPYGTGSGTVMVVDTAFPGKELITSLNGTQAGKSLVLLPVGLDGYGANDNAVYPTSSGLLDFQGIAFSDGIYDYNIYYSLALGRYQECISTSTRCYNNGDGLALASFSLTSPTAGVPEPSLFVLLTLAFLGFLFSSAIRAALPLVSSSGS
jgi:hypothetical protein